jgi:hypothetical protein
VRSGSTEATAASKRSVGDDSAACIWLKELEDEYPQSGASVSKRLLQFSLCVRGISRKGTVKTDDKTFIRDTLAHEPRQLKLASNIDKASGVMVWYHHGEEAGAGPDRKPKWGTPYLDEGWAQRLIPHSTGWKLVVTCGKQTAALSFQFSMNQGNCSEPQRKTEQNGFLRREQILRRASRQA